MWIESEYQKWFHQVCWSRKLLGSCQPSRWCRDHEGIEGIYGRQCDAIWCNSRRGFFEMPTKMCLGAPIRSCVHFEAELWGRHHQHILESSCLQKVYSFIEITSDTPHMFTIKELQVIRNTAHRPSTQASYTIGSGTTMQENQQAAQIAAKHNIIPQMAPYMSWIFLVLVGIDPGVSHLGGEIVSHNTTDAVMAFRSEASMTKFVGAVTLPWTKLALISASLEISPENLVQCLLWDRKFNNQL